MATISGFGGAVTLPTDVVISVQEWTLTIAPQLIEIEAAFGEQYDETDLGPAQIRGTISGKINASTAPLSTTMFDDGDWDLLKGSIVLTMATGKTFTFAGCVSNIQFSRPHRGYVTITADISNSSQTITAAYA